MRSAKFSSCSDAGFCCETRGIPIPELLGHLLLSVSQCPAWGILSGSESSAPSWTHRLHLPSSSGSKEGWFGISKPTGTPQPAREESRTASGHAHLNSLGDRCLSCSWDRPLRVPVYSTPS